MARIKALLEKDYAPDEHIFLDDKPIAVQVPGQFKSRRPDFQVVKNGKILCAVEIGYTDPEKISLYEKLKIPDIRWYQKDGRLVTKHKREQRLIVRSYSVTPFCGFRVKAIRCGHCCDPRNANSPIHDMRRRPEKDSDDYDIWCEEFEELLCQETFGLAVNNGRFHGLIWYCDRCDDGGIYSADETSLGETIFSCNEDLPNINDYEEMLRFSLKGAKRNVFEPHVVEMICNANKITPTPCEQFDAEFLQKICAVQITPKEVNNLKTAKCGFINASLEDLYEISPFQFSFDELHRNDR
jgi:hypothetical protein